MKLTEDMLKLYTPKQWEVLEYYYKNRPRMLINHGAVRSGKTMVDNDIFVAELRKISLHMKKVKISEAQYILAGASLGTIEKNVLSELRKRYGIATRFDKFNRFKLFGVTVCCCGHDDAGQVANITGMTAYGAYINEAHLANKDAFDEIQKRCSGDKDFAPVCIMDANPDAPSHFLKVDYIDKTDGKFIYAKQWKLTDNIFLNDEALAGIINTTPSGVYYDRKILGLWVTADGIVYRDFNEKIHIVDAKLVGEGGARYIFANGDKKRVTIIFGAVDWGYEHKGSIGIFAETEDGTIYLIECVTRQHMLIDFWIKTAQEFIHRYGYGVCFYCDSARPEHIKAFLDKNIWAVNASKNIEAGIEEVAKRFKTNRFFIFGSASADFISEIYGYVWDEKKGLPVKQNDDVMDMVRYGIYTHDKKRGLCK